MPEPVIAPTPAASANVSVAEPTATGGVVQPGAEQPVLGADGKPVEKAAEGVKAEGELKPAEKPKDEAKPEGAPEKYEFTGPEGLELDKTLLTEFEATAKELNLTQDQANKLFGLGTKIALNQVTAVTEAMTASAEAWAEESRADKEFGGDSLDANLAVSKRALATFGSPKLTQLLNDTGLGNHPEIIRTFFKIGKQVSGDSAHQGQPRSGEAKPFYNNSQHNR